MTDRLDAIAAPLRRAARRFGTPLHVFDVTAVDEAAAELIAAFPDPWVRQYSVKANDVAAVVRLAGQRGFGANVVSAGEWAIARHAGIADDAVSVEGVGKSDADLRAVVRAIGAGRPPRWISVESPDELAALARIADGLRPASVDVLFRLNPDVAPETHSGLAVGAGASKFGMTETELSAAVENVAAAAGPLRPRGLHVHVGSQLGAVDAWRDALRRGLALLGLLRGSWPDFDTLDVGGGFPVAPPGTAVPTPARFAREVPELLAAIPADRRPARLAVEPGRFLVARAGWLVATVLHVRDRGGPLLVLDAGMTELIRPALYGAVHPIVALTVGGRPLGAVATTGSARPTRVEGPLCESTDSLGVHDLPPLRRGDLVAVRDAGAYAASLASTYNGRPRAAQVLLRPDGELVLARRRGRRSDLG